MSWTLVDEFFSEGSYRRRAKNDDLCFTDAESLELTTLASKGLVSKPNGYAMHTAWKYPGSGADAFVTMLSIGNSGNDRLDLEANLSTKVVRLARYNDGTIVTNGSISASAGSWSEDDIVNIRGSWGGDDGLLLVVDDATAVNEDNAAAKADSPDPMTGFVLNATAKSVPDNNAEGCYLGFRLCDRALSDAELEALSADAFRVPSGGRSLVDSVLTPVLKPALIPALTE